MREAIAKELVGAVQEIAGNGYAVTTQETTKNNGVKMIGIEIVKQGGGKRLSQDSMWTES